MVSTPLRPGSTDKLEKRKDLTGAGAKGLPMIKTEGNSTTDTGEGG